MKIKTKQLYLLGVVLIVIIISVLLYGVVSGTLLRPPVPSGKYNDFAKCLTQKSVIMYGAYWCGHCSNEKAMFGDSFKYVTYVECDPNGANANPQLCTQKGITGYPTWQINGTLSSGEKTLEQLSSLSGCPLPSNEA